MYRKLVVLGIVSVYLVILAGAVVRMTGSGMGCPDWPKCFGEYIPPTSASELPENYREAYAEKRFRKNTKLASGLRTLGFDELAVKISEDEAIYEEEEFNVFKTYTEYINRLIGALSGLIVFGIFLLSLKYFRSKRLIPILSFTLLIAMGFQGWFGSIVVSTNLLPGSVSIHMIIALLIVGMLIWILRLTQESDTIVEISKSVKALLFVTLLVTLIQIAFGSQVRQGIDVIAHQLAGSNRESWISQLSLIFPIHRSFSILVLLLNVAVVWNFFKYGYKLQIPLILLGSLVLEIISGIVMAYLGVPPYMQALHLVLASIGVGVLFYLLLNHRVRSIQSSR